jgi:hypothetical protein
MAPHLKLMANPGPRTGPRAKWFSMAIIDYQTVCAIAAHMRAFINHHAPRMQIWGFLSIAKGMLWLHVPLAMRITIYSTGAPKMFLPRSSIFHQFLLLLLCICSFFGWNRPATTHAEAPIFGHTRPLCSCPYLSSVKNFSESWPSAFQDISNG